MLKMFVVLLLKLYIWPYYLNIWLTYQISSLVGILLEEIMRIPILKLIKVDEPSKYKTY